MSSATFKGEAWTLAVQPTHQVIAAHGKHHEIVGYFIAEDAQEVSLAMDIFDMEYGSEFDRLVAVPVVTPVVRHDPAIYGPIVIMTFRIAS